MPGNQKHKVNVTLDDAQWDWYRSQRKSFNFSEWIRNKIDVELGNFAEFLEREKNSYLGEMIYRYRCGMGYEDDFDAIRPRRPDVTEEELWIWIANNKNREMGPILSDQYIPVQKYTEGRVHEKEVTRIDKKIVFDMILNNEPTLYSPYDYSKI